VTWRLEFTNLVVEGPRGFIVHEVGYEYNYAVIAMCVTLIILGAGALSIDHLLWPAKPTQVGPLSGAPQTSSVT